MKGGREAAVKFMDGLKMVAIVQFENERTLHPASHTHRQMNDQQLAAGRYHRE